MSGDATVEHTDELSSCICRTRAQAMLLMRVCMAGVSANYASCQWDPSAGRGGEGGGACGMRQAAIELYHPQCRPFWHSFIHNLLRVAMPAIMIMPPAINCASNDGNKNYNTRSIYIPPFLTLSLFLSVFALPLAAHCCLIIYMHSCVSCATPFIHLFIH